MLINGIRLSKEDGVRLKNSAAVAQALENKWVATISDIIKSSAVKSADSISIGGDLHVPDFERLLIQHYFEVQIKALKLASSERELDSKKRLAAAPKTLKEVLAAYDKWRKGLYKPKPVVKRAKEIKDAYVDAIQKTWKKYSEDFRNGDTYDQEEVIDKVVESTDVATARAKTIVRTETTRYYNEARRNYYDESEDVTHYLFIAVRDKATTPWCTSSTVNGKRGRSGLVYAKGDPLLDKETPPCHWNCRSELLPLNRFNPAHRKLIEDSSLWRRNHVCTPLPLRWAA